jgi:copper chaperone CopZ
MAAVMLLHLIGAFLIRDAAGWVKRHRSKRVKSQNQTDAEKIILTIKGMTCNHCTGRVQKALEGVPGVVSAEIDLGANSATVSGTGLDARKLTEAVARAGYEAAGRPLEETP